MYLSDKTIEQRLRRTLKRYGCSLHKTRKAMPAESRDYCYWIEDNSCSNGEIRYLTLNQVIDIAERLKEKNS
ncbi:MAG: hypothetical protein BWX97_00841 [Firmicutes bacterium ADurb.Bin146]|nr:MAG: hypothetical protein BWX97_00841 [Firmicutes bacterium ADurb.Bin146]